MDFNEIRPYTDKEIKEATQRLLQEPLFFRAVRWLLPELTDTDIVDNLNCVSGYYDFQKIFMYTAIKRIVKNSSDGLSYSGLENISKDKSYLYIANHRDIFLDSGLLEIILFENGYDTTQITFGSNLMSSQLLVDVGKINKMFKVERGGDKVEMYNNSMLLSHYIRNTVESGTDSVWIAQRNGRTKDGHDLTQPGLLKMLNMSGSGNFAEDFRKLNIVPLTISYEYEPCDILKVKEMFASRDGAYTKKPGEDLQSIISGVIENKGRIHLTCGKPIDSELNEIARLKTNNEKIKALANEIDKQIYGNYKLWKTNYIAFDLLNESQTFSSEYSQAEREDFLKYLDSNLDNTLEHKEEFKEMLLELYAGPVVNSKL
ncbi:MAG: 1-acyl-sn-glycerol-3-phosphate acyltransferase [Bacteroidales bacterium]|nr:1-acyl-sn-glycerol-3-phosphate acyltransferase [Bacteroidales bacterium]MCF8458319.1 1-acyl-sn-glycerol-3-phosphate acyltransferase [Bacteroidales bacterium]